MDKQIYRKTYSLCPVCLSRVPAVITERNGMLYMDKNCEEHGSFSTPVWKNHIDFNSWVSRESEIEEDRIPKCPENCGICGEHLRGTCCTLLHITSQCNLKCPHCFASGNNSNPTLSEIMDCIDDLTVPGKTLLQISGGEPSCREDLPQIIMYAVKAGCKYVQLNTNGIRLGMEEDYAARLKKAGLSFVFMQFDGVTDDVFEELRGRKLLEIKKKAIENCGKYGLGVTLVPMIVPGVNDDQIGEIIRFGIDRSPVVRGVHFQPVSYFHARSLPDDNMRYTLDELIRDIELQTNGSITSSQLKPSHCDHARCGFHGDYIVLHDGKLMYLEKPEEENCCCGDEQEVTNEYGGTSAGLTDNDCCCGNPGQTLKNDKDGGCCCGSSGQISKNDNGGECCRDSEDKERPAEKNREFVGRRWFRNTDIETENTDINTLDGFFMRLKTHAFTITSMAFMDAGNIDLERLRKCSLHVYDKGRMVPFCVYYLNRWDI